MEVSELISRYKDSNYYNRKIRQFIQDDNLHEHDYSLLKKFIDKEIKTSRLSQTKLITLLEVCNTIDYYRPELIPLVNKMISSKNSYLNKLEGLDLLLNFGSKIERNRFISLNKTAIKKSSNDLVNLQAYINLSFYDLSSFDKVTEIINRMEYPTPFYRLFNSIRYSDLSSSRLKDRVSGLTDLLNRKKYSDDVKRELKKEIALLSKK